jgi:hypothetical protein
VILVRFPVEGGTRRGLVKNKKIKKLRKLRRKLTLRLARKQEELKQDTEKRYKGQSGVV